MLGEQWAPRQDKKKENTCDMGNGESIQLPNQGQDLGYVAIVLRYSSKVQILYPTNEVENGIDEVVK